MAETQTTTEAKDSDFSIPLGTFGDSPHAITEGMNIEACPFLNMVGELGLGEGQMETVMRAFFSAFGLSEEELNQDEPLPS